MKKEIIFSSFITIISLGISFAAGYYTNQLLNPPELETPILAEAKTIIEENAYFPLPNQNQIEYGMIRGLISSINDPYASFVEPAQHEIETDTFQGHFGGIGAEISKNEEGDFILYPYTDSPSFNAGIQNGDILISVDNNPISSEDSIETVISFIRGPVGEKTTISIFRPSIEEELQFTLKREDFPIPSVTWRMIPESPGIGLIQIKIIAASTADEVSLAINQLEEQGVSQFILDLRANGGGLLDSGIDIARLFLDEGIIIYQQYHEQEVKAYKATSPGPYSKLPLAILIDRNTASAAEIIAGALQAHGRAPLIGTQSHGKNTIQLVFTLSDESSVHVTSGAWWLQNENEPNLDFKLQPDRQILNETPTEKDFIDLAIQYFNP